MRTYSSMKALQLLVALADCEGRFRWPSSPPPRGFRPAPPTGFSRRCSTAGLSSRMR
ncbi:hypothetical protein M5E87_04945 [Flavonifractor plautii]|nr:hypothetical protein M5E87_04945 [Flavonifractor plautii]